MIRHLYLLLTELLYHQLAWAYDLVAAIVSAGQWKAWVRSILPDLTGNRILELGHGPGHLQASLLERGHPVIGLDKSPEMTRQASRRLRKRYTPALVHGDAFHLPFAPQTMDCVVATFPTNYITARESLSEIYRVLTPEGKLVVVPGARLVAPRGVFQRFAAGIFRFFGLSQDWRGVARQFFVIPMEQAGFVCTVERRAGPYLPFTNSEIFVIIGLKQ
ncbi:MAG TPA: methyltransferase domain-containing protein [Anaerolineales bacterium]|nr:methyltransferase domain-containing protein [Anaerolineales bacterium]